MKSSDKTLKIIAYCGLYCSNCKKYLTNKCHGCQKNEKASWCKIRTCCSEQNIKNCASCKDFPDPSECKKFNNPFARIIEFVSQTRRIECIHIIKQKGELFFIEKMDNHGKMSLPRTKN